MVELEDTQELESCGEIRVGSTPTTSTIWKIHPVNNPHLVFFTRCELAKALID